MTKILAIGESLFDYLPEGKVLGGAPLNFSVHAVQLGAEVALLTKLGQDELGTEIRDSLVNRGVDVQYIQWDPQKSTGKVKVDFQNTEPIYTIVEDVAWDYLEYQEKLAIKIHNYDCIYFGTLAQRNEISRRTIEQIITHFNGFKMLDLNLRKPFLNPDVITKSIHLADGLKLNLEEALFLKQNLGFKQDLTTWLKDYHLQWVVLTQGELGTKWIDNTGEIVGDRVMIKQNPNADSVGAGDGVCAVVATKYLDGLSPAIIVEKANQIGAYIASCPGATPIIPLTLLLR